MNFEEELFPVRKFSTGPRWAAVGGPGITCTQHITHMIEDQRASLTVPICVATVRARWSCCSIKHTLYQTYAVGQFRPDGVSVSSGPTALRLNFSSVPTIGRFDIDAHEL